MCFCFRRGSLPHPRFLRETIKAKVHTHVGCMTETFSILCKLALPSVRVYLFTSALPAHGKLLPTLRYPGDMGWNRSQGQTTQSCCYIPKTTATNTRNIGSELQDPAEVQNRERARLTPHACVQQGSVMPLGHCTACTRNSTRTQCYLRTSGAKT